MISRLGGASGGGVASTANRGNHHDLAPRLRGEETKERADSESTTSRDVSWRCSMIRRRRSCDLTTVWTTVISGRSMESTISRTDSPPLSPKIPYSC